MEIIIGLFILSAIIFPIAIYKRRKSPRFRLIETSLNEFGYSYTPQVRIDGIWLNIRKNKYYYEAKRVHATFDYVEQCLDAQDALEMIERYRSAGKFAIHSNRKLNSNEKAIIVE